MSTSVITDDEAQFFEQNGYLVIRRAIQGEELKRVQGAMMRLTEFGSAEVRSDPDYAYGVGHKSGGQVLKRVEYVVDKSDEMKVLMGNPFILNTVEKLMGPDLIPTWDSMVLKLPGEGIIVPWHRDAGAGQVGDRPIFNVDFYLDAADEDTCVWVVPGSHKWPQPEIDAWLAKRRMCDQTVEDFRATGAVPAIMQPGDVLLHNILVLHGSPSNSSDNLRRVVYYEFRTAHVEDAIGPHTPAYIPRKQRLLRACIERRKAADYVPADETPFAYNPPAPYDSDGFQPGQELPTYRYPHADFWRQTA